VLYPRLRKSWIVIARNGIIELQRRRTNVMRFQVPLIALLVLMSACEGTKTPRTESSPTNVAQPAPKTVLDIPRLMGKSAREFEKLVGSPVRVTPITNDPDMMPGEYRDYKIANTLGTITEDGLWVRFYKGVAHHITFDLPRVTDTPQEALLMAGIDVGGATARIKAPAADRWTGNFNGINFKDVAALKLESDMRKYSTVQAELAQ